MLIDHSLTGDEPITDDYMFTPVHTQTLCCECNDKDAIIDDLRAKIRMYEEADRDSNARIVAQLGRVTVSGIY
jgi:hypothetical protein